jgi:hypothetical protein
MTPEPVARRYPASAFPAITGVRLTPLEVAAKLVNLSATGILVECANRPAPGGLLTVHFAGTFVPASVPARVVRCEVAGIAPDGSLRYHLGLAFSERLALPDDLEADADAQATPAAVPPVVAAAVPATAPASAPILRNRW